MCGILLFLGLLSYQVSSGQPQERALFSLIQTLLPPWLTGIVFATIIVVFSTALDNQIVAGSAIVYGLIYQRHDLSQRESILNARLITVIISLISFAIAVIHPSIVRLQSFTTHISLIIGPVLVMTLFTSNKKSNEAVFWSICLPTIVLCILYFWMRTSTFLITTPMTFIILRYYDKWTAPKSRVFK
jgi:Na+/proline symporter